MRVRAAFVQTLASQLVQSVGSIATGVIIARSLGPAGQGEYAALAAGVAVGSVFASLGQFQGNVLAAAEPRSLPRVLLLRAIIHGLLVGILVFATVPFWTRFVRINPSLSLLFTIVLSVETVAVMIRGINLGQHHVTAWNVATLTQRFAYLAGVSVLLVTRSARLTSILGCWAIATLLSVGVSAIWIWLRSTATSELIRRLFIGWSARMLVATRAFVTLGMTLLLIRCDLWMLGPMLGIESVGQMSIAITLGEWLWYIPSILGNLLFAVVAADVAGRSTNQICLGARAVTAMLVPVATVLSIVGPKLVVTLYGQSYVTAGNLFVLLLPGMTALGIHLVIDSFFAGGGFPPISIWSAAAALATKVGLNFIVVPSFGARGAAVVTSFVYAGLLTCKVTVFASRTGVPFRQMLVPNRGDLRYLLVLVRSRLGWPQTTRSPDGV